MEDQSTPPLVLFEPKWEKGGHHPSWFKELVGRLLCSDREVIALCPEPEQLRDGISAWVSEDKLKHLTTHRIPDQRELFGRFGKTPFRMFRILTMARYYNRHLMLATEHLKAAPECVWFGLTDLFALRIRGFGRWASRLFTLPYTGLYFFPPPPPRSLFYRIFFDDLGFFRGENCKGIAVLSDRDRLRLLRQYAKPVWTLPDFHAGAHHPIIAAEQSNLVVKIKALAGTRKIILMAGDISPRKGLVTFLSLAEECSKSDFLFVVAGALHRNAFSKADRQKIMSAKNSSNVYIYPYRIDSDSEFDAMVSIATALYAVYPDFDHSSNMIIQAAVSEVPIMVASGKEMGTRVDEFDLGATVDPNDLTDMKRALFRLSENDFSKAASFKVGCHAYRHLHSADSFAREVLRICTTSHNGM